jgi:dihydrofolate reductase
VSLNLILARSRDNVIGIDGKLPWKLPADMEIFRVRTMAEGVVVGRKTYESMLTRHSGVNPLKGRVLIVISSKMELVEDQDNRLIVTPNLTGVLNLAVSPLALGTFFIAGGSTIYQTALPLATRIFLTEVEVDLTETSGVKTYGPEIDESEFVEVYRRDYGTLQDTNEHPFTWRVLDRKPETNE